MVQDDQDPVQRSGADIDLYEISTWEPRTVLDRISIRVHWAIVRSSQFLVILLAIIILVGIGGVSIVTEPAIGVLSILSIIPAFALAAYVWHSDVTPNEPLSLMAATFVLSVLFAGFAALVNGFLQPNFAALGFIGMMLFFFLVVGPIEETVKLLAVRAYAYTDDRFQTVLDGAVYGAIAGLGFATIENGIYIGRALAEVNGASLGLELIGLGGDITAIRAMAGPGHVVYSAFAGFYLGLAKFNPDNRGPIIVKGLIIAAVIHALYNSTVGLGAAFFQAILGVPDIAAFFLFVVLYVSVFGYLLYRKLDRYRRAYQTYVDDEQVGIEQPEQTPLER